MGKEEIQAWLVARISGQLEIPAVNVDIREPFINFGLDSAEAVILSGELGDLLGCRLSPTLVWDYPCIEELAWHLAGNTDQEKPASGVWVNNEGLTEPIAIIGIGCRFPGAGGPEAFWRLLRDGVDAITEVPKERWDIHKFYDPNPEIPGKMTTRWGGFLKQVDRFDYHFFGISPREAVRMDPQQRLLLEVAVEALEDAGQAPESLAGTETGVFIGVSGNDYGRAQMENTCDLNIYDLTGNAFSIAANRISYLFDFRGPSMAIDTACSSSLVAVHLACQSLRNGEATLALAGGVNIILSPGVTVGFSKAGMMAPDGRCKTFDASADGYVRGEGAGIVVLKPLSKALADGDMIYALVRGSALNQDGRSNGLTAPSRQSQEALLREAYRRAKVSPAQIQYVEAHGTGTALGDPIEVKALGAVLATGRPPQHYCRLGSVKSNIGHLESAAGIAGLIKAALSLKHRELPPSLHFKEANPHIPFGDIPLRVQKELTPWPEDCGPALAGVSSFGFGGSNAHMVLEEAPRNYPVSPGNKQLSAGRAHLLPLSARNPEALKSLAIAYKGFLETGDGLAGVSIEDICYTAGVRRSHHDHRLTLVAHSGEEAVERLDSFLKGNTCNGLSVGRAAHSRHAKLAFVFSGQGPQWWAMGRELLEQEPVFRATVEECDQLLKQYTDWSLIEELTVDETRSRLNETRIAQPAIFALQVALAVLWRSWGMMPDSVLGHSMGEVAAAHVAGILSLPDAVRVIFYRSRLLQQITGRGKMAAVELPLEETEQILAEYKNKISLAAHNSPVSTVLSGEPALLEKVVESLHQKEKFCRFLPVDYAFHSYQTEPLQSELVEVLQGVRPRPSLTPIFSTVTGQAADGRDFNAAYWGRNMTETVRFASAIDNLIKTGHNVFVEISPHPVLAGAILQCLSYRNLGGTVLSSLRRGEKDRSELLRSLGKLHTLGYPVNWLKLYSTEARFVSLPTYPWQRESCWLENSSELSTGIKKESDVSGSPGEKGGSLRELLHAAEPGERRQLLETHLRERVAGVLGLSPDSVDVEQPLNGLGLDSIMAVELKNRIQVDLGIILPLVKFLDSPSISQVAARIIGQLEATNFTSSVIQAPEFAEQPDERKNDQSNDENAEQLLAKISQLSDEEISLLLNKMLDEEVS